MISEGFVVKLEGQKVAQSYNGKVGYCERFGNTEGRRAVVLGDGEAKNVRPDDASFQIDADRVRVSVANEDDPTDP